jgi:hypothetical protein
MPFRSHYNRTLRWLAGFAVIGAVAAASAGPIMSNVEQPEYAVISVSGAFEVRAYPPMIVARAEVEGERKSAIEAGFRLIAAYIFGANAPNAKIAMTAPVEQQASQTIAMTAPVIQEPKGKAWTVRFIMPKEWSLETLPAPSDDRVKVEAVPARRMVAIRFTGLADDATIAEKTAELSAFARERGLSVRGEPLFAFYNPPWTLPMLRRNEIMLELASA